MSATAPEQQLAETLCRGFFSWHLQHDYGALARLGDGTLEIDLLRRACRHKKNHIPALVIVGLLDRQYRRFLEAGHLTADGVKSVVMSVELEFEEHDEQKDPSVWWFGEHGGFVGCKAEVSACVGTSGGSYTARRNSQLEWPKRVAG